MAGRPDKLTDEMARKIVNLIASGSYVETAAAGYLKTGDKDDGSKQQNRVVSPHI